MADLETLVGDRLAGDNDLAALLATVDNGSPAIFVEQAPGDDARRWDTAEQFPRLILSVERFLDPARGRDGTVTVDVQAPTELIPPIEARVRARLNGAYWHPTGDANLVTREDRSTPNPALVQIAEDVDAYAIAFALFAFPTQPSSAPNVVAELNDQTATKFGSAVQADPASWDSDDAAPAIYWHLESARAWRLWPNKRTTWTARLRGHVLGADPAARDDLVRRVSEWLSYHRDMLMADNTWLRLEVPEWDATLDPIRAGQIMAIASYVTKPPAPVVEKVQRIQTVGSIQAEVP